MKNNYFFKNLIIPLLLFLGLLSYDLQSQTTDTFNTGAGATWTVPAGVTSVDVKVWGGGGAGGGTGNAAHEGGGGGSGGYALRTYAVTPGQTFTYTVGASVAGDGDGGTTGNPSSTTFSGGGGFATLTANGGNGGGTGNNGSLGTGGTQSNGDTGSSTGGSGSAGSGTGGGKGGDAPGSGGSGGAEQTGTASIAGNPGIAPGGGGSGSRGAAIGGAGAAGRVTFTYTVSLTPDINVQGNGASIGDGDNSPSSGDHTDFGTANVAGGTVVRTFTIQNLGAASLTISGATVAVTGTNAADFTLTTAPAASVAVSSSTTFQITFDPSGAGSRTATLTITSNDPDAESTYNFDIIGVGGAPEMIVQGNSTTISDGDPSPSSADHTDFGSAALVGGTVVRTFTIQNSGTSTLTLGTITISGTNASDFTVTANPSGTVASGGGSTTFSVTFNPSALGARTATISIANDDADENPYNFDVTGSGVSIYTVSCQTFETNDAGWNSGSGSRSATNINGSANSYLLDNGEYLTSSALDLSSYTSADITFTFRSTGFEAGDTFNVQYFSGSSWFVIGTYTFSTNFSNGVSQTITINVTDIFPYDFNGANEQFRIFNNGNAADDDLYIDDICVYGYGNPAEMDVLGNGVSIVDGDATPTSADHTDFGVGAASSRTFTIQNTGDFNLNIGTITVGGANAASFTVSTAPASIVVGTSSTTFVVDFVQAGNFVHNATISIDNDDSDENPYNFSITATGIASIPEIDVRGNSVPIVSGDVTPTTADHTDFGTGITRTYTIHNVGLADLTVSSITASGGDASMFSDTGGLGTITAGSSRSFDVTFTPTSVGVKSTTISIVSTDSDENPYTFTIQGTGIVGEIDVTGRDVSITNGDATPSTPDNTSFGSVFIGSSWVRTFRINNRGTLPLNLTGSPRVQISGSANMVVTSPTATSVPGGSSLDFDVTYSPTTTATDTAIVSIANNDTDENPFTYTVQGTGANGAITPMPGCLGDTSPTCNNSSNATFSSGLTGWTATNWSSDSGAVKYSDVTNCNPCINATLSQNLTGLTAASETILVKFKLKMIVGSCNMTGRAFDFNLKFDGTTYMTSRLLDTQQDAFFILSNGGILVATDATNVRTHFSPGGCTADGGPDAYTTVYVSIPKTLGATTGTLSFTVENPQESGASQMQQIDLFMDDVEITADAAACGFLWLKGNTGTSTTTEAAQVQTWNDNSILGNHASQATAANRPLYNANILNFNPGLSFDGSNDYMTGAGGFSSGTQMLVFKSPSVITTASGSGGLSSTLIGANLTSNALDYSGIRLGSFTSLTTNETYGILRGLEATGNYHASRSSFTFLGNIISTRSNAVAPAAPTGWVATRNGTSTGGTPSTGGSGYQEWAGVKYTLAASPDATGATYAKFYNGHLLEVITYPTKLTDTEFQKVNSYLAIKYGLTINQNYLRGSGSTVYGTSGYTNRIIGIGREDCQGLHQRQSKSEHAATADNMFTIGYNSLIGTSNSASTGNDLPDNTFLIMGDNAGVISAWKSNLTPASDPDYATKFDLGYVVPTQLPESTRLLRTWKITSTNTLSSSIRFRLNASTLPSPVGSAERIALVFMNNTSGISSATFTGTNNVIIPMTKSIDGTTWDVNYAFPSNSTRFMTIIKYNDCYSDLICINGTTTWNGSAWSNGAPTVYNRVVLNGAYNATTHGDFHCCRLEINAALTIGDGDLIEVESDITNNASIVIANNGSLMQYADSAVNSGAGTISLTRQSTSMKVGDYTYWSSPVNGFDLGSIPKDRAYFWNAVTGAWSYMVSGVMNSGQGYIVMTDNTSKTVGTQTTVTFSGIMNNGRVFRTINPTTDVSRWNLLGNPYPSALDALDFVTDNTDIGGSLYFWTHNTRIDETNAVNTGLSGYFTQNDYAVWSSAGSTAAAPSTQGAATTDAWGNTISGGGRNSAPTGRIAAGQAFFAEGLTNGTVTFKNCQRTTTAGLNNDFYKSTEKADVKNRFWLDVENESGAFKQMLVGYFPDASNDGDDRLYDAKLRNGDNLVSLYSIIKNPMSSEFSKYTIQGRALPFRDSDVIPLGFRAKEGAKQRNVITISKTEGFFDKQDVFLEDILEGKIHNLKKGPYFFNSDIGEFNDRFVLTFSQGAKSSSINTVAGNVVVSNTNGKINVKSSKAKITSVAIHNIVGSLVYSNESVGEKSLEITSIAPKEVVLIVTTTLEDGEKESVKIIH